MRDSISTTRYEWPIVLVMTVLGAVVRLWGVHRLGLSHFDEGMYAMAAFWVAQPSGFAGIDPSASLYAPAVFHLLNGLSYLVLGYGDLPLILVSQVSGVAAIPLSGWIGCRLFGPGAGASAAALSALSGAHVAFSRMALTDALFLTTWLLAMAAGLRYLERPGVGRALALGIAVGLAQNTKYNGWLSGVIVGVSGLIGLWPGLSTDRRANRRLVVGLVLAAIVSVLCYLPWYRYVDTHGGYAALMAHQRGYLGRIADWPTHLRLQLGAITALSGGPLWQAAAWGLALAGLAIVRGNSWDTRRAAILGGAAAAIVALPTLAWWLGLAWLPWLLRDVRPGWRLLGVWWAVLSVLTPAYHPYARLWLPLHAVGWLLSAGLLVRLASAAESSAIAHPAWRRPASVWCATVVGAAVLLSFLPRPARALGGLLAPTDFFRREILTATLVAGDAHATVLKVLARPHAAYYLFLDDAQIRFQKVGSLDQVLDEAGPGAWVLVDEAQLRQSGDLHASLARLESAYERVPDREFVETLSPVTLLDVAPEAAFGDIAARRCRWLVFRPRSARPPVEPPR